MYCKWGMSSTQGSGKGFSGWGLGLENLGRTGRISPTYLPGAIAISPLSTQTNLTGKYRRRKAARVGRGSAGGCRCNQPLSCFLTYTQDPFWFLEPLVQSCSGIKTPRQRDFQVFMEFAWPQLIVFSQTGNKEPREVAGLPGVRWAHAGARKVPESLHQAQQTQTGF